MTELRLWPFDLFDQLPFLLATGPATRTVATEFAVTSGSWWLTQMRLWRASWELVGPLSFRLYAVDSPTSGTPIPGTDTTIIPRGLGWQLATVRSPVKLTTGQVYRACCWAPRGVNYSSNYFSSGVTNGALSAPSRAASIGVTQGAFALSASLVFPTSDGAGTNWWVDVMVTDLDPATVAATPLTSAVDDVERRPVLRLSVDWDRDGYHHPLADLSPAVAELSIERAATADLPLEVGLVEGYAAGEVTATLEDEISPGVSAFEALAPYRADAELLGRAVAGAPLGTALGFRTSSGEQTVKQLTGQVRSLRVDSATRQVTVKALDLADRLRAAITLPTYGMLIRDMPYVVKPQAVIDYVLRRNAIFASPPPHPSAQISCTGHGWLAAEVGTASVVVQTPPATTEADWWVPGPFDLLAVRGAWGSTVDQYFFAREPYTPLAGAGIGISAWLRVGNDMGQDPATYGSLVTLHPTVSAQDGVIEGSGPDLELRVWGDGRLGAYLAGAGATVQLASTTHWQYVGVHLAHRGDGTTRISLRVGQATSTTDVSTPAVTGVVLPRLVARVRAVVDWSNLQVWYDPDAPVGAWPGEAHTSQAQIDPGLNLLSHLPTVTDQESWEVIKAVVGAELGLAGFDEDGLFFFRQRRPTDPWAHKTITSDCALTDLAATIDIDSVRNVIATDVTAAFTGFGRPIFTSEEVDQFDTPAGVVATYLISLPSTVVSASPPENRGKLNPWSSNSWDLDIVGSGYVAVDADSPSTAIPNNSGLTVFATILRGQAVLEVRNFSGFRVRLATTDDRPALRLRGHVLTEQPAVPIQARHEGSIGLYGERVLPLPSSPWRQLPEPMVDIARELAARLGNPLPVMDRVEVTGDPERKLGDTVRLIDRAGLGTVLATIVLTRHHLSRATGFRTELSVRPLSSPGLGIWDSAELGSWDATLVWGP